MMLKRFIYLLLAVVMIFSFSACKKKESETKFPISPINFVVPFGGGGTADLSARALCSAAEKTLGQPITIINKPGGYGTVGLMETKNAKKDGYTIGMGTYSFFAVIPHIQDVDYTLEDFEFINAYCTNLYGVVVKADSPYKNINDLIKAAEKRPLKLGSTGFPHVFALKGLEKFSKAKFIYVPFSSGNDAVAAVAGGHVDVSVQTITEVLPFTKSGSTRVIASPCATRLEAYPDVPTIQEQGYDIAISSRMGIVAPKGIPAERLKILKDAFLKASGDPEYLAVMERINLPAEYISGDEFKVYLSDGYDQAKPVVEEMGLAKKNK